MQFLDNKYTKWYFNIIYKAADRKVKSKTENHHILPKALYPEYKDLRKNKWNGVQLTHKEHFICHLLLTKMVEKDQKHNMIYALNAMMNLRGEVRYTNSYLYEKAREKFSLLQQERLAGENNPRYGVKVAGTKTAEKIGEANRGKVPWNKGIPMKESTKQMQAEQKKGRKPSEETVAKISAKLKGLVVSERNGAYGKKWFNNGTKEKQFLPNLAPKGWIQGRIKGKRKK